MTVHNSTKVGGDRRKSRRGNRVMRMKATSNHDLILGKKSISPGPSWGYKVLHFYLPAELLHQVPSTNQ
jgi:hypothetical protein